MLGNVLQIIALSAALVLASPALFQHPYSGFLGLRLVIGVMMLVADLGMLVFLIDGQLVSFFVLGSACARLSYVGGLRLLQLFGAERSLTARGRRNRNRRLPKFSVVAAQWLTALALLAGFIFSIAASRP
jgi:hypothetical protein